MAGNTGGCTNSRWGSSEARAIVMTTKEKCDAIDAQTAALPPVDEAREGLNAVEAREQVLSDAAMAKFEAVEAAETALAQLRETFDSDLNSQLTPNGADLDNVDYVLLRDGLIDSPAQLQTVMAAHDNFTFASAAQKYAVRNHWDEFDAGTGIYIAEGEALRSFGQFYFDMCDTAIHNLNGVAAMQVAEEGEITRLAIIYGIHENLIE